MTENQSQPSDFNLQGEGRRGRGRGSTNWGWEGIPSVLTVKLLGKKTLFTKKCYPNEATATLLRLADQ